MAGEVMKAVMKRIRRAPLQKRSEPIALIDMDGTIANYDLAMHTALGRVMAGHDRIAHPLSEEMLDQIKLLIKQQPGFWHDLVPIRFGLKIAIELKKLGFRLMVLTKGPVRSKNAWTEKVEWCAKWLPTADVTITHDKSVVYGRILVDDYPEYIERWLEWRPRGVVIMPAQSWNLAWHMNTKHPQVYRVGTEEEFARVIPILRKALRR